jgi:hypothetical protein
MVAHHQERQDYRELTAYRRPAAIHLGPMHGFHRMRRGMNTVGDAKVVV